ncbi:hypothetical protein [Pseudochelatococcus sp. G4_1912]
MRDDAVFVSLPFVMNTRYAGRLLGGVNRRYGPVAQVVRAHP